MAKRPFSMKYKIYDATEGFGNARQWRQAFRERLTDDEAQVIIDAQYDTLHTILGVDEHASLTEIKDAYYRLIKKWHPDNNPRNIKEATIMAQRIIAAYTILTSKKRSNAKR